MPSFADLSASLYEMINGQTKDSFTWHKETQEAFVKLKEAVSADTCLSYPDYSKPFYLFTDASYDGLGAVLMQMDGDSYRPLYFISRALSKPEKNYTVSDLNV